MITEAGKDVGKGASLLTAEGSTSQLATTEISNGDSLGN